MEQAVKEWQVVASSLGQEPLSISEQEAKVLCCDTHCFQILNRIVVMGVWLMWGEDIRTEDIP
eukprot:7423019-Prorocentrum_lima.AAC.1